jgi:Nucleotide-diphospho-sugar transferase
MASLYVGVYVGYKQGISAASTILGPGHASMLHNAIDMQSPEYTNNNCPIVTCPTSPPVMTAACPPIPKVTCPYLPPVTTTTCPPTTTNTPHPKPMTAATHTPLFGQSTGAYVKGISLLDRDDFATKFDIGVPVSKSEPFNNRVLLLHGSKALPTNASLQEMNHLSVEDATVNCNYLSLILTEPGRHDQCIAIMGQYNSFHVHKFMRYVPGKNRWDANVIDKSKPLELVRRSMDTSAFHTRLPDLDLTQKYWKQTLQPYLSNYKTYLDKLRPIAKEVASKRNNTIVVMVSNHGQSELLTNFLCNTHARGLDTSSILVFATDHETEKLSMSLGLATFYDKDLFGGIPKKHAARFGDSTYTGAIFSKVYCVHLVGMLGYDYLFQDIDMVWYRHPLDYFHQQPNMPFPDKDIYMQEDGNRAEFYAPYSGNTGFYYVRNNDRTLHFMNQFLLSGDLILATATHQAPFLSVLSEHASLHGLKVKILPDHEFPGGYHYQKDHSFMKRLLNVTVQPNNEPKIDPWIFHMR